jgi:hypothetical protein
LLHEVINLPYMFNPKLKFVSRNKTDWRTFYIEWSGEEGLRIKHHLPAMDIDFSECRELMKRTSFWGFLQNPEKTDQRKITGTLCGPVSICYYHINKKVFIFLKITNQIIWEVNILDFSKPMKGLGKISMFLLYRKKN